MDDDAVPSRQDQARLYLATLEARMDPDEFRMLVTLLMDTSLTEQGAADLVHEVPEEDAQFVTPAVIEEFLVVMAVIKTGRMDQQLVDLGHGVTTVVTQDVAEDPEQMRRLRHWVDDHPGP